MRITNNSYSESESLKTINNVVDLQDIGLMTVWTGVVWLFSPWSCQTGEWQSEVQRIAGLNGRLAMSELVNEWMDGRMNVKARSANWFSVQL